MKRYPGFVAGLALALAAFMAEPCPARVWDEILEQPPWRASLNMGGIFFEGDEATQHGFAGSLRLGYDYSPRWTFEGVFNYAPHLAANTVYDYPYDRDHPEYRERRRGLAADSAAAFGFAVDALYHLFFLDNRHWDPYLIGGIGLLHFTEERWARHRTDVTFRYGFGLAYHFNPAWSIRTDLVGILTAHHTEFNFMPSAGIAWRWGVQEPSPVYVVTGGPVDKYTLYIEFETDKAEILPGFFAELDAIGETLRRDPTTTARIEGHADRRKQSAAGYNWKLSERRANAVLDYLNEACGIERDRMQAAGYGFARPVAPNDPIHGNRENRRVEIYIHTP